MMFRVILSKEAYLETANYVLDNKGGFYLTANPCKYIKDLDKGFSTYIDAKRWLYKNKESVLNILKDTVISENSFDITELINKRYIFILCNRESSPVYKINISDVKKKFYSMKINQNYLATIDYNGKFQIFSEENLKNDNITDYFAVKMWYKNLNNIENNFFEFYFMLLKGWKKHLLRGHEIIVNTKNIRKAEDIIMLTKNIEEDIDKNDFLLYSLEKDLDLIYNILDDKFYGNFKKYMISKKIQQFNKLFIDTINQYPCIKSDLINKNKSVTATVNFIAKHKFINVRDIFYYFGMEGKDMHNFHIACRNLLKKYTYI